MICKEENKRKKILYVGVSLLLCFGFLFGCAKKPIPYNAVMLGDWYIYDIKVVPEQPDWFTDTFWQENTISVYYMNENYDPNDELSEEYMWFENAPRNRMLLIKTQEEFNRLVKNTSRWEQVDFEREMFILYMYPGSGDEENDLTDARVEGGKLILEITYTPGISTPPQRRLIMIKTEQLDVTEVQVLSKMKK